MKAPRPNPPGSPSRILGTPPGKPSKRTRSATPAWIAALLILFGMSSWALEAAGAESIKKTIVATVTIVKWSKVEVAGGAAQVTITEADIRRGYVDLNQPTRLVVASNAPGSYFAEIVPAGNFMKGFRIMVGGHSVSLGAGGGGVSLRSAAGIAKRETFEIYYRIYLAEGVRPGTYAWAPSVTVTTL